MTQCEPYEGRGSGNDPVPGERREAVTRNVVDERSHDYECDEEADDEADGNQPEADPAP